MGDRDGGVRRWRLAGAVAVALAMHGALLVGWVGAGARGARMPLPSPAPSAPAMQWVTPIPQASPRQAAAPAVVQTPPPRAPVGMAPARRATSPVLRTAAELDPAMAADAVIVQENGGTAQNAAAPAPLPTASGAQPSSVTAAGWDTDGIARALREERAWQRRQGALPAWGGPVARTDGPTTGLAGGSVSVRESVGADGSRLSRVQGSAGTYCVRVPSANRMPEVGAAPRLAPVTNCP